MNLESRAGRVFSAVRENILNPSPQPRIFYMNLVLMTVCQLADLGSTEMFLHLSGGRMHEVGPGMARFLYDFGEPVMIGARLAAILFFYGVAEAARRTLGYSDATNILRLSSITSTGLALNNLRLLYTLPSI